MVRIPRSSNTFDAHHLKSHHLGELCKLVYGKNLSTSQLRESGFPVFGANGVIGWNNTYLYKSPMVVISCRGEYSGIVNMTPAKSFVTNNSIICEIIDPTIVFKRFLYWFLSIVPRSSVISGSAQPQVIVQDLKRVNVSCPPLPEQRRIAEILDTIDNAIKRTESLISKLKAMKHGLLHDLLTHGLDKNGKLRDPKAHPEQFKDSPLGRIPREWVIQELGKAAPKIQDGTHFSPKTTSGPFRYLTSKNIRFGHVDLSGCGWISEKEHEAIYSRCDVRYGDILLTKDGANTGNAAINNLNESAYYRV